MTNQDLELSYLDPVRMRTVGDAVDLGDDLRAAGIIEGRALVAKLQELGSQTILSGVQPVLEQIRRVHDARLRMIEGQIMLMPSMLGHINRDAVLRLIRTVMNSNPEF